MDTPTVSQVGMIAKKPQQVLDTFSDLIQAAFFDIFQRQQPSVQRIHFHQCVKLRTQIIRIFKRLIRIEKKNPIPLSLSDCCIARRREIITPRKIEETCPKRARNLPRAIG